MSAVLDDRISPRFRQVDSLMQIGFREIK